MKLVLSTENKRLSVKLPGDKCDRLFNTLAASILNTEPVPQTIRQTCIPHKPLLPTAVQTIEPPHLGYTGFLYIRCQHCGKERGFCTKLPLTESRCRDCGEKTKLENLHRVQFTCKCGSNFSYRTNITDDMFEIACINCGAPNVVFKNPKTGDYSDEERK